jgi:hypothetical protein
MIYKETGSLKWTAVSTLAAPGIRVSTDISASAGVAVLHESEGICER